MHININDIFYSQNSHQHVSACIPAILRVMLYKYIKVHFILLYKSITLRMVGIQAETCW